MKDSLRRLRVRFAVPAAILAAGLLAGAGGSALLRGDPALAAGAINLAHALHLSPYRGVVYRHDAALPYTVQEVRDGTLPAGSVEVRQPGAPGLERGTGVDILDGSRLVERKPYGRQVLRAPRPALVAIGTNPSYVQVAGRYYHFSRRLDMVATAYDATWASNGRWTGGPSALGLPLGHGVVAVDPRVIPLGTHLYIPGYGLAVAADTGSAIVGDRIDLFMWGTPHDISAFGERHVTVYVLGGGAPAPAAALAPARDRRVAGPAPLRGGRVAGWPPPGGRAVP